jgi:acetylornithine aminotransferase
MLGTTFGGNHLACAAAIGVLEAIEQENLMQNANAQGNYLMQELQEFEGISNIRGAGLMIGFDVSDKNPDLKKNLLWKQRIFTGEAKPNVIRLLPSLALKKEEADIFLEAANQETTLIKASS